MNTNRLILGVYLEPTVWVCNEGEHINPDNMTPEECLGIVFSKKLASGIEVCVQRQGFAVVAFPQEIFPVKISNINTSNLLPIGIAQVVLSFFNAFLFLLYDQRYKYYERRFQSVRQAIEISDIWRWRDDSEGDLSVIAVKQPMQMMKQHRAPDIRTEVFLALRSIGELSDTRYRTELSSSIVDNAFDLLFIDNDIQTNWQLLSLLNKAVYLVQKAEFAQSHVLSWSVAEILIGIEWERYILSTDQTINNEKTMNRQREKNFIENADYTASIRAEILEMAKVLPYSLYKRSISVRKIRNAWLHKLRPVTMENCINCYEIARDMLSRKLGFEIHHPGGFYVSDESFRNLPR
jgi:hypothetical protein